MHQVPGGMPGFQAPTVMPVGQKAADVPKRPQFG